jgi:hypothetical protein
MQPDDTMKPFEWWQIVISGIQTIVLIVAAALATAVGILTVAVAFIIGVRQTEIASRQTQINEDLLSLQYAISTVLQYEPSTKRLIIHNLGHTNIYLAGYGLDDLSPAMQQSPPLIGPAGSHYIQTADLDNYILSRASGTSHANITIKLFLLDARQTKYLQLVALSCEIGENQQITVNTRPSIPTKVAW